jgi:hypothetical protein
MQKCFLYAGLSWCWTCVYEVFNLLHMYMLGTAMLAAESLWALQGVVSFDFLDKDLTIVWAM